MAGSTEHGDEPSGSGDTKFQGETELTQNNKEEKKSKTLLPKYNLEASQGRRVYSFKVQIFIL